jgi:catechol 2,3-dioxygenase-like lactoylglutathione lyase family enzyme
MIFGRTTPILRIFDEAKAKEFYVDFLGFKVDWEHRFEETLPLYGKKKVSATFLVSLTCPVQFVFGHPFRGTFRLTNFLDCTRIECLLCARPTK